MRKGVIDLAEGRVVNVIEAPEDWTEVPEGFPHAGCPLFDGAAEKGWAVVDGVPVAPKPREPDWDAASSKKAMREANQLLGKLVKRLMATQFAVINDIRSRRGQQPLSLAQYLDFFDASADGISDQQFIDKIKSMFTPPT